MYGSLTRQRSLLRPLPHIDDSGDELEAVAGGRAVKLALVVHEPLHQLQRCLVGHLLAGGARAGRAAGLHQGFAGNCITMGVWLEGVAGASSQTNRSLPQQPPAMPEQRYSSARQTCVLHTMPMHCPPGWAPSPQAAQSSRLVSSRRHRCCQTSSPAHTGGRAA